MIFSSLIFLYAFLPLFLLAYYASPETKRNAVAVVGSVLFYAWGEPVFALILTAVSLAIYALSQRLAPDSGRSPQQRRVTLTVGLVLSLGLLGWCKYANFFVDQANSLRGALHLLPWEWTKIALPIGVSFFTFQKVSYLVDVYRGTSKPARSATEFLLFVALFPQLIAGPIIRYHDIAAQIIHRDHRWDLFTSGLWRFSLGLGRKVLIANPLGQTADKIFALDVSTLPQPYAWLGMLAYTFQIYFDFAGYSDMAIGLARMMGFSFMENFDRPYTSRTVNEFWRRWHISLGAFMREYLYIPLGGNRGSAFRTSLNLWLVFLASGFWHGASWTFVAWGALHGTLLSLERLIGRERLQRVPAVIGTPITFLLVAFAWILFRADTLPQAIAFFGRLWAFGTSSAMDQNIDTVWPEIISNRTWAALALASTVSFIPDRIWQRGGWDETFPVSPRQGYIRLGLCVVIVLLATAALASVSYNPFIYYRF